MTPLLRKYQDEAAAALLANPRSVVKSPAGSGKTWIGASALQSYAASFSFEFPVYATWLCNTVEQKEQAKAACALFPHENLEVEFICYAGAACLSSQLKSPHVVVADECQHVPAETFRKIFDGYAGWRWGLSATPERTDELKADVFDIIGPIVYEVKRETLIAAGQLCQGKVTFLQVNDLDEFEDQVSEVSDKLIEERKRRWPTLFNNPSKANEQQRRCTWQAVQQEALFNNPKRDTAIVWAAKRWPDESTLVIVASVEHGKRLLECLPKAELAHSKLPKKKRAEIMARFKSGETKILLATSLADEGLDVPRASVLVLAAAGKSSAKAEQRTGRVLRTFEEKTHGEIYDFNDQQHSYLRSQTMQRLKTYVKLGYAIDVVGCEIINKELNETLEAVSNPATTMQSESIKDTATVTIKEATVVLEHTTRAHSRHSPSSLEPILRCAGFLNDPDRDATLAERGQLGHHAVEKKNPELCNADESLKKGVIICIKYLDKLAVGCDEWLMEQRIPILDQSGSFDHLIFHKKHTEADLCDLKFAYNKYPANGMQPKAYVVGVFAKYPALKKIRVHMIHPFLGEVYCEEFTRGDEEVLVAEVRAVIERARKADVKDFRITKYCGYCARAGSCPLLGGIAHDLASRYAADKLELPAGAFDTHGSSFKDPVKAAALLRLAGPVEQAASSWRRGAMRLRMEEGEDLPGFKLVSAKGKRTITNVGSAYDVVKSTITPEEFINICSVPISGLEEIYSAKAPKGKKAAFKAALSDLLYDASAVTDGAVVHRLVVDKDVEKSSGAT